MIAGPEATTVVPPRFQFRIDEFGNLIAVKAAARGAARLKERSLAAV
ncbi:MAG: hypothetical protein HYU53_18370 [Acidobacteria bacterium]|nr:hypothetical protein [Acidobacteriota bacterium]